MPDPAAEPEEGGSLFRAVIGPAKAKAGRAPRPARPAKAAPKPVPAKQRRGMEQSIGLIYGMTGAALEMRGVRFYRETDHGTEQVWQPSLAGRAMKLGAPSAGKELSEWVNNIGWLSALLGPVLGNESFTTLAKVAGLPMMLHVLQVRPQAAPLIQPLVMPMLADLWVGVKRAEKQQREAMEALADMDQDSAREFNEWAESIFTVGEQVLGDVAPPVEPEPAGEPQSSPAPAPAAPEDDGFGQIDAELGMIRP